MPAMTAYSFGDVVLVPVTGEIHVGRMTFKLIYSNVPRVMLLTKPMGVPPALPGRQ